MQQPRAWDSVDDALQLLLCTSPQAVFEGDLACSLPVQCDPGSPSAGQSCSKSQLRQRVLEVWRSRTLHLHGNDPGSGTSNTPRASTSSRASPGSYIPPGSMQAAAPAAMQGTAGTSSARSLDHAFQQREVHHGSVTVPSGRASGVIPTAMSATLQAPGEKPDPQVLQNSIKGPWGGAATSKDIPRLNAPHNDTSFTSNGGAHIKQPQPWPQTGQQGSQTGVTSATTAAHSKTGKTGGTARRVAPTPVLAGQQAPNPWPPLGACEQVPSNAAGQLANRLVPSSAQGTSNISGSQPAAVAPQGPAGEQAAGARRTHRRVTPEPVAAMPHKPALQGTQPGSLPDWPPAGANGDALAMVQLRKVLPQQPAGIATQVHALPTSKGGLGGPLTSQQAAPQLQHVLPQPQQADVPVAHESCGRGRAPDSMAGQVPVILQRLAALHGRIIQQGLVPGSLAEEVLALVSLLRLDCIQHTRLELHQQIQLQLPQLSASVTLSRSHGLGSQAGAQQEAAAAVLSQAWSTPMAVQYACAVLEQCHTLVCSLGRRLGELLLEMGCVRTHCQALTKALQAALATHQAIQSLRTERAYDGALPGSRPLALVGLLFNTSSGGQPQGQQAEAALPNGAAQQVPALRIGRTMEQQRLSANRERGRDAFFALMREASALTQALQTPGAMDAVVQELKRPGAVSIDTSRAYPGGGFAAAGGSLGLQVQVRAETVIALRSRCCDLLAATHPANLEFLAQLFAKCVLQAASTGEAVVDAAVASLAQRDLSRFQRLSQRLQGPQSGGGGPATGTLSSGGALGSSGGAQGQPGRPTGSGPQVRGGAAGTPGGAFRGGHGGGTGFGTSGSSWPGAGGAPSGSGDGSAAAKDTAFALAERVAWALGVMQEFPPVQQGYVLFLLSCDSATFSAALGRVMARQLQHSITTVTALAPAASAPGTADVGLSAFHSSASSTGAQPDGVAGNQQQVPSSEAIATAALTRLSPRALYEHVLVMNTLARFLSLMTYTFPSSAPAAQASSEEAPALDLDAGASGVPGSEGNRTKWPDFSWPAPAASLVKLLEVASATHQLPALLPTIAHLLWFAHHDLPSQMSGAAFQRLCLQLSNLRKHGQLAPGSTSFGPAAACLRSVLDDLMPRLGLQPGNEAAEDIKYLAAQQCSPGQQSQHNPAHLQQPEQQQQQQQQQMTGDTPVSEQLGRPCNGKAHSLGTPGRGCMTSQQLQLSQWDVLVDTRLLELCCPDLDSVCRQLQHALLRQQQHQRQQQLQLQQVMGGLTRAGSLQGQEDLRAAGHAQAAQPVPVPGTRQAGQQGASGMAGQDTIAGTSGNEGDQRRCSWAGYSTPSKSQSAGMVVPRKIALAAIAARAPPAAARTLQQELLPPWLRALLGPPAPQAAVQLQLQQALVAQYSTDEQPMKLREVVGYVADMLAVNAFASASSVLVPQALAAATEQLAQAVATLQAARRAGQSQPGELPATTGLPSGQDAAGQSTVPAQLPSTGLLPGSSGKQQPPVAAGLMFSPAELESVKAALLTACEPIVSAQSLALLQSAEGHLTSHVSKAASQSLEALLPQSLPPAVKAAAAAMVAQLALKACAQRLVQSVPGTLRTHLHQQVEPTARTLLKNEKLGLASLGSTSQQPGPAAQQADGSITSHRLRVQPAGAGAAAQHGSGHQASSDPDPTQEAVMSSIGHARLSPVSMPGTPPCACDALTEQLLHLALSCCYSSKCEVEQQAAGEHFLRALTDMLSDTRCRFGVQCVVDAAKAAASRLCQSLQDASIQPAACTAVPPLSALEKMLCAALSAASPLAVQAAKALQGQRIASQSPPVRLTTPSPSVLSGAATPSQPQPASLPTTVVPSNRAVHVVVTALAWFSLELFTQHTELVSQTLGWTPEGGGLAEDGCTSGALASGRPVIKARHAGGRQMHALLRLPSHIASLAREFDDYALMTALRQSLQRLTLGPVGLA